MSCEYCKIIEDGEVFYQDDKIVAFLPKKPATAGHIIVAPKKHYVIFEEVPDEDLDHIFNIANRLSALVFERLGVSGTNIIVQNGKEAGQITPHFAVNIIPRTEDDKLDFQWEPKKLTEDDFSSATLFYEDSLKKKDKSQQKTESPKEQDKKEDKVEKSEDEIDDVEIIEKETEEGEENYLIKQLERIP